MTLTDRIKDMIIAGGHNVYSIEVENAISTHPAVDQVAVIGIPHDVWGEQVHAIVVLRSGATATGCAIVARPHPTYGESIVAIVTPVEGTTITLPQVQEF